MSCEQIKHKLYLFI